jgi:hypothetical protein
MTREQRLNDIAERMKTAKGKELDKLVAEVDAAIGFDDGDEENDRAVAALRDLQLHGQGDEP